MELQVVKNNKEVSGVIENLASTLSVNKRPIKNNPFIEANTTEVSLSHLKKDCTIPVFSKDNETTISHQEFIECAQLCAQSFFPQQHIEIPQIRVSHTIKGRVPTAIGKPVKELLDNEKTIYYERMAFAIEIPSISENVNGNQLNLVLGGVRAYNQENLYSKKSIEKFKFFIGYQNMICTNLCVNSDGYSGEIRVGSILELKNKILEIISNYTRTTHLKQMEALSQQKLTETQFAQLIGKTRLYQYLPKEMKSNLPEIIINDSQLTTVAKDYFLDKSFCRDVNGDINLWNVYNLFTSAVKSSYIDFFIDRNVNASFFVEGVSKALNGNSNYHWFLS
jgi:hypothetical protein